MSFIRETKAQLTTKQTKGNNNKKRRRKYSHTNNRDFLNILVMKIFKAPEIMFFFL